MDSNPIELYVLYTEERVPGLAPGRRFFLFTDRVRAHDAGLRLKAQKPSEVSSFDFYVGQLEREF